MYRALAVLRVVVLLNAIGLGWYRRESLDHPGAAVAVLAGMAVWTAFVTWAYAAPQRRRAPLLVADLLVALVAIAASPYVKGDDLRATLPGFWVMGVVLAWAIHWRWQGGLVAATVVSVADLAVRSEITQTNYSNIFLLMLGGPIVGFLSGLLQEMARDRDRAERAAAAAAERARLARVVHDGVLQVLALVQRRGAELGGEAAELGRLAGEQEVALRALVQTQETSWAGAPVRRARPGRAGDRTAGPHHARRWRSRCRAARCRWTGAVAEEVVALVRACLHNVSDHVGSDARAWVLLEDLGDAGHGLGARRRARASPVAGWTRPPPRDGSGSPSRSAAGSPGSAARPP